ncbi:hypothetical protein ILP92_07295 [Maribius pontilimi]|uniref:Uncharacterized protein n=1 Tax=Palleronia pontilimi TaxID=1964209 RepID=A0A934IH89_9RHOB|nr:hypothetical protein [Palleronia pontilimi]MBJ3762545.1 hypothetical protein [Palleronia pontilimi]
MALAGRARVAGSVVMPCAPVGAGPENLRRAARYGARPRPARVGAAILRAPVATGTIETLPAHT